MVDDIGIFRSAKKLIEKHSDDAAIIAIKRATEMLEQYPTALNRIASMPSGKIALIVDDLEHLYPSVESLKAIQSDRMML